MKLNLAVATLICISLLSCGSDDEATECQICHIDYSYEYSDTDPNGNPVTATESGRESTDEACGTAQQLAQMKTTVQGDAVAFEADLASQGAQNISTTVVCEMSN